MSLTLTHSAAVYDTLCLCCFQNHDAECTEAHKVQSEVLVPQKLPIS